MTAPGSPSLGTRTPRTRLFGLRTPMGRTRSGELSPDGRRVTYYVARERRRYRRKLPKPLRPRRRGRKAAADRCGGLVALVSRRVAAGGRRPEGAVPRRRGIREATRTRTRHRVGEVWQLRARRKGSGFRSWQRESPARISERHLRPESGEIGRA